MKYLFRLLNEEDDPDLGLTAKDPYANQDVEIHVGHGSKSGYKSQFISTTASYDAVYEFAQLTYKSHIRVVRIRLDKLQDKSDVTVIDLTDDDVRDEHIRFTRADNVAKRFEEVLIVGHIPASCIELIYTGKKENMPMFEPSHLMTSSGFDSDDSGDSDDSDHISYSLEHDLWFDLIM